MTDLLRQQANDILYQALDLTPDARADFVEQACAANPDLHALVTSLLRRLDQLDDFLEVPAHPAQQDNHVSMPAPQPGEIIGNWRVIRELGRGGMGLILLVERSDGVVEQTAALKIVQDNVDSKALLARFQSERQILANLNHPDIARLIDAGSTSDGRPFFVMEYMNGIAIDQYCTAMALTLSQRIHLFARVCRAVHYAHQHLIIHRDLKPANILIGRDGSLKLLDFGIAKLLHDETPDPDNGASSWLLTPMYASPEQLEGRPLSIGSDVYSLGVVLYGLLTGRSPYHVTTGSVPELLAHLTEHAPTPPSEVVTQERVGTSASGAALPSDEVLTLGRKLARQLRGDLDNILLKAIRRQPQERYASADDFEQDLQRYLGHLPIHATPPSRRYRMSKLVQRYPWGVAATSLAVVSLIAGTSVALWQAHEATQARMIAENRFDQTRQLARSMLFEINDSLEKGPTAAREKLVATSLQYLKQLSADRNLQADLKRDVASAYERIGDIVGNQTVDNLGRTKDAERYYQEALKLRLSGASGANANLDDLIGMREIHQRLGDIAWSQGRVIDTQQNYEAAIADAREVFARTPTPAAELELLSRRRYGAAILYTRGQPNAGQLPQAVQQFAQLRQDLESFMQRNPGNADVVKIYVPVLSQLVDLYRVTGDLAGAYRTSLLSLDLAEKRLQTNSEDPRWLRQLSITLRQLGDISIEQGRNAEGFAQVRKALAIRQGIAEKDGGNERAIRDVAIGHSALADAMVAVEDYAGAQVEFALARDTFATQAQRNPGSVALQSGLLELQLALANAQYMQHQLSAAGATLVDLQSRLANLPKNLAWPAADRAMLEARITLLRAQVEVNQQAAGAASAGSYQSAQQALEILLSHSESDPLDTYQQRESAVAWQQTGSVGLRAGQVESACKYLDLAAKRYDALDKGGRLNASDKRLQADLLAQRKACGSTKAA